MVCIGIKAFSISISETLTREFVLQYFINLCNSKYNYISSNKIGLSLFIQSFSINSLIYFILDKKFLLLNRYSFNWILF